MMESIRQLPCFTQDNRHHGIQSLPYGYLHVGRTFRRVDGCIITGALPSAIIYMASNITLYRFICLCADQDRFLCLHHYLRLRLSGLQCKRWCTRSRSGKHTGVVFSSILILMTDVILTQLMLADDRSERPVQVLFRRKRSRYISVSFEKGKTNLIIGRSGSGKTVLMKCIVAFTKPIKGPCF